MKNFNTENETLFENIKNLNLSSMEKIIFNKYIELYNKIINEIESTSYSEVKDFFLDDILATYVIFSNYLNNLNNKEYTDSILLIIINEYNIMDKRFEKYSSYGLYNISVAERYNRLSMYYTDNFLKEMGIDNRKVLDIHTRKPINKK